MGWLPFDVDDKVSSFFGSSSDPSSLFEHKDSETHGQGKDLGASLWNTAGRIAHGALEGATLGGAGGTALLPGVGTILGGLGGAVIGAGEGLYNDLTADSRGEAAFDKDKAKADAEKAATSKAAYDAKMKWGQDDARTSAAYKTYWKAYDGAEKYSDTARGLMQKDGAFDDYGVKHGG